MIFRGLLLLCLIGICSASEEVIQNQQLLARIKALEIAVKKLSISDNCAKALSTKCEGNDSERLNKRQEGKHLNISCDKKIKAVFFFLTTLMYVSAFKFIHRL